PIGLVLADAEFDSEPNHEFIRQRLGARSIIPAKRRGIPQGTIRNQMFRAFPKKPYRQRAKIETIFSVVKRKLSSSAPGRSLAIQIRQALLLGLTYNLYRLRPALGPIGCQQSPTSSFNIAAHGSSIRRLRVDSAVCLIKTSKSGKRMASRVPKDAVAICGLFPKTMRRFA
ncbi:MAG: transposase, partial [Candidatus Acidiferrum sp.]